MSIMRNAKALLAISTLVLWATATQATTPETPPAKTRGPQSKGEVTHRDVYVRSGPSMNHYPVCKLQAADRVTIVGEQGEWYEVLPPPGAFSLISSEFVDTADNENGVVNGDNVRVRAGSSLNDQKYTVQVQLSRGTKVTILGRNPDGFYRIAPPPGATSWINRSFVEKVPEALLKLEAEGGNPPVAADKPATENAVASQPDEAAAPAKTSPEVKVVSVEPAPKSAVASKESGGSNPAPATPPARLASTTRTPEFASPTGKPGADDSPLSSIPSVDQRKALEALDAAMQAEQAKEASKRNITPIVEGYQRIIDSATDEVTRKYAEARLTQAKSMADLIQTLRHIQGLHDEAEIKRKQFIAERANADYQALPPIQTGFDAQGELRTSALYPPGTLPRRYRLIDPKVGEGRTVAYIEVPVDSNLAVDGYLGQYVGVRAAEKRLQIGGVDPVPVFIVRELVRLQPSVPVGATGP